MKWIKWMFLLSSFFFLQYCEQQKEIDFDVPFEGEKIVLYGFLTPDRLAYVEILKTQAIIQGDPDYELMSENVLALLLEEGEVVDTFVLPFSESAVWVAPQTIINPNLRYSVSVELEDKTVHSEAVVIPEKVWIDSLVYELTADSSLIYMQAYFTDPNPQEENYYYVSWVKMKEGKRISTNSLGFGASVSDMELDGNTKSFFKEESVTDADEIVVRLYHISKEFVSFYDRAYGNGTVLGNQYSTQLPPWTNVNGGYGVVGAYQVDSVRIEF